MAKATSIPELLALIDQLLGLAGGSLEGGLEGPAAEPAGRKGKGKHAKKAN